MKLLPVLALPLLLSLGGCGCERDTNVITPETVEAANKHRIEAIDNDPNMTPEDKEKMKRGLRLIPGGPPGSEGRAGPPTKR
ncbi:MAG: hypothetical protein KIS66_08435 [Fimbriimonadaceae bacterium]|nr:hypothetical protein [Fimbriimonadaceae bacterium]